MTAVVQRVLEAAVTVDGLIVGKIAAGMLVLVAIERTDADKDVAWMANKLVNLRIFRNAEKHFDLDVREIRGSIMLVSNFTVSAETKSGRRPSFDGAAPSESGRSIFDALVRALRATPIPVETGSFGADMRVTLTNDGPATFIVSSTG